MKRLNETTGQFDTVYVKALDSMPVGSQIEFTGSTIPAGWEEVNDYSTDEIDTGKKWIDGKPIYRKVISVNNQTLDINTTIDTGITNRDTVTNIEGIFYNGSNGYTQKYPLMFVNGNTLELFACTLRDDNKIGFNGNSSWGGTSARTHTFIIEYTKTTD